MQRPEPRRTGRRNAPSYGPNPPEPNPYGSYWYEPPPDPYGTQPGYGLGDPTTRLTGTAPWPESQPEPGSNGPVNAGPGPNGAEAIEHRPMMRWYRPAALRLSQLAVGAIMIAAYLAWAASEHPPGITGARPWHLASALPLVAALARFAFLTGRRTTYGPAPVEDLLTRDGPMLACEAGWLALFVAGL